MQTLQEKEENNNNGKKKKQNQTKQNKKKTCYMLSNARCHVQIGQISYTGSFMLDKYRSHFKLKLSTLFISLYDRPSSAANLPKRVCQRLTGGVMMPSILK